MIYSIYFFDSNDLFQADDTLALTSDRLIELAS